MPADDEEEDAQNGTPDSLNIDCEDDGINSFNALEEP